MKQAKIIIYALGLLLVFTFTCSGQSKTVKNLGQVSVAIERAVQKEMPGWNRRRAQPITGNLLGEVYNSNDVNIKLSVISYESSKEAAKQFKEGFSWDQTKQRVDYLGEEGYEWGYRGASFAFKINNLGVFVSITAGDMSGKEEISKQFAKIAYTALKDF
jgi:hypothetical protein